MNIRSCARLLGGDPAAVTDAADQIRALKTALRRTDEKLRMALAAAHLGFWERDLLTGEFTASDICKTNLGLPREAPLTFEMFQAMRHPDDLARVSQAHARSIETGEDFDVEYRVVRTDGSIGHLIARGHKMQEHAMEAAQKQDAAQRAYIQSVATTDPADQIAKAAELRNSGAISEEEFQALKAKALS